MLTTETYQFDEEIDALDEEIDALNEKLDDLDASTDKYNALQARRNRLQHFRRGLRWQRNEGPEDEDGWGDAEVELGSLTAAEHAKMHRDATDGAGPEEMRIWFVAASTERAPYAGETLEDTFMGLADCHPGFVEWLEAKTNSLGVPRESGNRSSTSSAATDSSGTSTNNPDSTTSSSSDSPTA